MSELNDLLHKYNISKENFKNTQLNWDTLVEIKKDYINIKPDLELAAKHIAEILHGFDKIHAIRFRLKNTDALIAKIIRKKIENPNREIGLKNYKEEITDLIGVRVLHLFKEDWSPIHRFIIDKFEMQDEPIAYFRIGDPDESIEIFKKNDCKTAEHDRGYRSVHYIVKPPIPKSVCLAEIQARTIYEEAWSEIDHTVSYPHNLNNTLLGQFSSVLNRLSGSSDEMGTKILNLKNELNKYKETIESLEKKIKKAKLEPKIKQEVEDKLDSLKRASSSVFFTSNGFTFNSMGSLSTPSATTMNIPSIKQPNSKSDKRLDL